MKAMVFCSPHWGVLQEKALSLWCDAQRMTSPLLLVPTTAMRFYWLSVLAKVTRGISGNSVSVLDYLAYHLAASCKDKLVRLAQPLERKFAAIVARRSLKLPNEWDRSGVIDSFLDVVEELELHGLSPETVQNALPNDETVRALTQWWRTWKDVLSEQGLWSLGDALTIATEYLRQKITVPPETQVVLVYGFTALTSARWNFLKSLLESMNTNGLTVYFFVPANPENPNAFSYSLPLIKQLKDEFGAEVCPLRGTLPEELQSLPTLLFRRHQPKEELKLTDRIVHIATAGEEQEVEMAVRLLVHWIRKGKLGRFSDALLVAQSLEPYLPALKAVSARYNLPFVILDKPGKPHDGLTNLIFSIWNARRSNWEGESLWQVLPSPYLRHPSNPQTPLLPKEKHSNLLAFVRQRLAESGSERWIELLKTEFGNKVFVKFISDFLKAVDELPLNAAAKEHACRWQKVLQFVYPVDGKKDEKTLQNLRRQLNALKVWSAEISGAEFVEILAEACVVESDEFKDAIRVASARDARGQVAPAVVLLGMSDGRFPPSPPMFELLTDKHREELMEKLGFKISLRFRHRPRNKSLNFATSFAQEQRMLFAETIGIATEFLVFTYPRTDPEGKPIARSLFLDEVEAALKSAGYIWQEEERDLSDVVLPKRGSKQGALPEGTCQAIDVHEATISAMLYAFTVNACISEVDKVLVTANLRDENLRERLLMEWKRWVEPQEGKWDGKGLEIDPQSLIDCWSDRRIRVTALEDYGHCPYRFFARNVLRLRYPYEVVYLFDPATLGDLWHRIVARFLRVYQESGEFPNEQVLKQVAQEVFGNHPQIKQAPQQVRQLLWEQIEEIVPRIWNAEKAQAENWQPVRVEEEISLPVSTLGEIPPGWDDLKLVMRPDRVDCNSRGKHRVADYKTGGIASQTHIKNGVAFQLPLYAFALKQEGKLVSEALFLKLLTFTSKGHYSTGCQLGEEVKGKQTLTLSEAISAAQKHALRYLNKIAQSDFTVFPFNLNESCRLCDFKALCRRHPLRLRERSSETENET